MPDSTMFEMEAILDSCVTFSIEFNQWGFLYDVLNCSIGAPSRMYYLDNIKA
jgi:hypothetical protein